MLLLSLYGLFRGSVFYNVVGNPGILARETYASRSALATSSVSSVTVKIAASSLEMCSSVSIFVMIHVDKFFQYSVPMRKTGTD